MSEQSHQTTPAEDFVREPWEQARALVVSPADGVHHSLDRVLSGRRWKVYKAVDCAEALTSLERKEISVVLCDRELMDGDWKVLAWRMRNFPIRPSLLVMSASTDDLLMAEVVNFGAYDILRMPFNADEVLRLTFLAWLSWKSSCKRRSRGEMALDRL